jgi:hypothetical protein
MILSRLKQNSQVFRLEDKDPNSKFDESDALVKENGFKAGT